VAMQFYASPEQIMRDRSEFARKNLARGRNVVVMSYADGVLFVAENVSKVLHKVSEIYDRIGFAAVGKYNEFENLRAAGVRMADLRGYSYARRDVTGRAIATAFAQTLGSIFIESQKPYEVEICIAEVGATPDKDELYQITYDGQAQDQPGFLAMGAQTDVLAKVLRDRHRFDMSLTDAANLAVEAIASVGGENGKPRKLDAAQLEVAVLDRARPGRKFRRITGAALTPLLDLPVTDDAAEASPAATPTDETPAKGSGVAAVTPKPAEPAPAEPVDPEPMQPEHPLEPEGPLKPAEPTTEPTPEPTAGPAPDVDPSGKPGSGNPDADPTVTPEVPPLQGSE
jgi:proteasome alpha subunit